MNTHIENKIEELYNLFMDRPNKILGIFNDFFGEARVDMQGFPVFEEFKSWICKTPICNFSLTRVRLLNTFSGKDFGTLSIEQLGEEYIENILNLLDDSSTKEYIKNNKFSNIRILVHFPKVRVTNEYDRFVDIENLYAKIRFDGNGILRGGFGLNRSTYLLSHFVSNYMHSHIVSIPTNNFKEFQNPCTGSGPINDTILSLNTNYDEDLWSLFCLELDKYTQVESINGVPYHRLENIGISHNSMLDNNYRAIYNNYYTHIISFKEFLKYIINRKILKFNYVNGGFSVGMSFTEFIITFSNEFITWYNEMFNSKKLTYSRRELENKSILKQVIIEGNKIYISQIINNLNNYNSYIGKKVCTFKGKDVTLEIKDIKSINSENHVTILNPIIALYLLNAILKVLNFKYGNIKFESKDSGIKQNVKYI